MRTTEPKIKLKSDWIKNVTVPEERTFKAITNEFDETLKKLTDSNNRYPIKEYFGDGIGVASSRNKLKNTFEALQKKEEH